MNRTWRYAIVYMLTAMTLLLATGHVAAAPTRNPLTLYSFCRNPAPGVCWGGSFPLGMVQGPDNSYYGITSHGGSKLSGVVYRLDPVTRTVRALHSFDRQSEGADPQDWLTVGADGNLYGALTSHGSTGFGGIFRLTLTGELTIVHAFASDDYADYSAMTKDGEGNLFGAMVYSGASSVFKITPDGTFSIVYTFLQNVHASGVVLASDGNLYGTTSYGGDYNNGMVYRLTRDGTFTELHDFTYEEGSTYGPSASIGPDGALYGVLGTYNESLTGISMYRIDLDGQVTVQPLFATSNIDDTVDYPLALMPDGYFYGFFDAVTGADLGDTIFRFSPQGDFSLLAKIPQEANGVRAPLIRGFDNALYGTTYEGGHNGRVGLANGTIFRYVPPPVQ